MGFIPLKTATMIAETAIAEAEKRGLKGLSVVVTDVGGNMRLAMSGDAQGTFGIDIAHAKCTTALGFRARTSKLSEGFKDGIIVTGLQGAVKGQFLPLGGAVPVVGADGAIIGAAGAAGGPPAEDEAIIVAAIEAAGLAAFG